MFEFWRDLGDFIALFLKWLDRDFHLIFIIGFKFYSFRTREQGPV